MRWRNRSGFARHIEPSPAWLDCLIAITVWLMVASVVGVGLTVVFVSKGHGHSEADWIQIQNFKNAAGELCCGPSDCAPLALDDVITTLTGFYIISLKETVPYFEATPAPKEAGGRYWRCAWGGKRRCFFAPPSSS